MKLARKPDEVSNLSSVFKDFDRENCGTIRKNQFLRALTVREMHYMISSREFDVIFKCFGVQRGKVRKIIFVFFYKFSSFFRSTLRIQLSRIFEYFKYFVP